MSADPSPRITAVMIGYENVGKTFFCDKLTNKSTLGSVPYTATIGASFFLAPIVEPGMGRDSCELQGWDTGGADDYITLLSMYIRTAQVALIFFDFSSAKSFDKLKEYYKMINEVNAQRRENKAADDKSQGEIQCILIGVDNPYKNGLSDHTQVPQASQVTYELGLEFARSHDSTFITLNYSTWDNLTLIKQNLINVAHGRTLDGNALFSDRFGTVDQHLDVDNEDMIHSNDKGNARNKKKCTIM